MDKLAKYKLDKAFTSGVELRLDDAPEVAFLVRLPSQYNRAYTEAVYGEAEFKVDSDGKVHVTGGMVAMKSRQEAAFFNHCLVSIDGEAVPGDFHQDYPAAVTELYLKASDLAVSLENTVDQTAKKSLISSTGSDDGQEENCSIPSLSSVAS